MHKSHKNSGPWDNNIYLLSLAIIVGQEFETSSVGCPSLRSFIKFQLDFSCGHIIWRLDWGWTSNVLLTWLASWRWLAVGQGSEFLHMGLSTGAACVSSQCGEHDRGLNELPKRPKEPAMLFIIRKDWFRKSCTSAVFYWPHQASPDSRGGDKGLPGEGHWGWTDTLCPISGSTAVPSCLIPF